MTDQSPLDIVLRVTAMLDELGVDYVLGGSIAASFFGEPRATADVDVAVRLPAEGARRFLARAAAEFYVPRDAARVAISNHDSFNMIATAVPFKVDVFVLGDGLLDRRQLDRRVLVELPNRGRSVWVTSVEDQVLRKLDWFRLGGESSDRQWRDIVGLLRISGDSIDRADLEQTAEDVGLAGLLRQALAEAEQG